MRDHHIQTSGQTGDALVEDAGQMLESASFLKSSQSYKGRAKQMFDVALIRLPLFPYVQKS